MEHEQHAHKVREGREQQKGGVFPFLRDLFRGRMQNVVHEREKPSHETGPQEEGREKAPLHRERKNIFPAEITLSKFSKSDPTRILKIFVEDPETGEKRHFVCRIPVDDLVLGPLSEQLDRAFPLSESVQRIGSNFAPLVWAQIGHRPYFEFEGSVLWPFKRSEQGLSLYEPLQKFEVESVL